ncbi:IclR family transcriptional regulator [Saccharopolyspora sp. K220]|uniref:IclR family transcriptional regulator n=1 Tax=Saccharopolyspora soli TaxID=2926618 RepID=UPI001F566EC5|nr:IclR family transcriptional regulator [Saccharopolyspora soli]MCI2421351.1 IclR family transcriptional regulator [Saccharopolyspora soli]
MPRTNEPGRSVSSRLLQVLFAFRPENSVLSLADLTRRTALPHATVHRLVQELLAAGALDRTVDGKFTIGLRLWELGTLAPLSVPLRTVALPFMEDLHEALHQHVQLAVLDGHEAVVVERFSARNAVGLASHVGGRLPLHTSAVGKVLLAHGGRQLIEEVLAAELPRLTPRTVTDPAQLRAELTACWRSGTATVHEETTEEADSVAARIVDAQGRVVAALSVVVRSGSLDLTTVVAPVLASAFSISRRLGWNPGIGVRDADLPLPASRPNI